jgi:hypothetical protein
MESTATTVHLPASGRKQHAIVIEWHLADSVSTMAPPTSVRLAEF